MENTGLFSIALVTKTFLPRYLGDDSENGGSSGGEAFNANLQDILEGLDLFIGPDPDDDGSNHQDDLVLDDDRPSTTPPDVVPREVTPELHVLPSPISSIPFPSLPSPPTPSSPASSLSIPSPSIHSLPLPPQNLSTHPRTEKKKGVGRVWNKVKNLIKRRFGRD